MLFNISRLIILAERLPVLAFFRLALHKRVTQWVKNIEWRNYAHPKWFDWATVWNKWPCRLFHNLSFPSALFGAFCSYCHTSFTCCCYSIRDVWCRLCLWTQAFSVLSPRFNLERKVRMDSTHRRCLGHCLIVNLTQHDQRKPANTQTQDVSWGFKGVLY